METVITGSIAYDYLMRFPGHFKEHFIADAMEQVGEEIFNALGEI